jgi:hypothetical protein
MCSGSDIGLGPAQAERGWGRSKGGAKSERTFASVDSFAWRNAVAHFDAFARGDGRNARDDGWYARGDGNAYDDGRYARGDGNAYDDGWYARGDGNAHDDGWDARGYGQPSRCGSGPHDDRQPSGHSSGPYDNRRTSGSSGRSPGDGQPKQRGQSYSSRQECFSQGRRIGEHSS